MKDFAGMSREEWEDHDKWVQEQRGIAEGEKAMRKRTVIAERLLGWGVPEKDLERILEERLDDSKPLGYLRDFDQVATSIMVLAGAVGCGKTTAAAWWLATSDRVYTTRAKLLDPVFITVSRIQRLSRYSEAEMKPIEFARRLVIDDLGSEYLDDKGNFQASMDALINARYENRIPTVITTNLTPDAFKERYGERVADRIRESGRFLSISAPSFRKIQQEINTP